MVINLEIRMILPEIKTCSKCHETKPLDEFYNRKDTKDGKRADCKECFDKQIKNYQQERKEEIKQVKKDWYEKHKDKIREKRGSISMYENKNCASYLGVVVAERLCKHLFKDVEVMPHNNTGFDIICNKGMKIDVKSASTTFTGKNKKYPQWQFNIDHNTIADFFILVTFDNRIDLNPLHLWMIPGKKLNHQVKASVALSRIHKWDEWKKDIKNAQICCAEIKASK